MLQCFSKLQQQYIGIQSRQWNYLENRDITQWELFVWQCQRLIQQSLEPNNYLKTVKMVQSSFRRLITIETNHQVDLQTGELADLLGFDKDIITTASYGTNKQTSQDWWPYFKTQICWNCDLKLSYLELDIYFSE